MKYYQKIDIPNWRGVAVKIYKHICDHTDLVKTGAFWNILSRDQHTYCYQQLDPVFDRLGFNLLRISFLVLRDEQSTIHQDRDHFPGFPERVARINIPVLNCEHSETRFYSAIRWNPMVKTLPNGITYTYHAASNVQVEDTVILDQPTVIRVRELHSVVNNAKMYPRISLTCAVDPDPVYLLEEN